MPLENYLPTIDDRTYDDIMREARTRIARYTPEWTDVNENDPGITLVELFAWLTELLIYRLGKVPQLNYLKFLELLGIELNPAEPALAEVTFPVLASFPAASVTIPEHTQVAAASPQGGGPPLIFETERALVALTAPLASLQAFDGYQFTDLHADNEQPGQGFQPFGPVAGTDSALLLGFDYTKEFPQMQLDLAILAFANNTSSSFYTCSLPQTQSYPSAQIAWEYWNGSEWRALSLLKDETLAFTQTGHILLKTPPKGSMQRDTLGTTSDPRYWIRARLSNSQYEQPPKLLAIRTNTVPVRQAETERDEVLGGSDGTPNQTFQVANTPVLQGTLVLQVDAGDGFQTWTQVDDFFSSSPGDQHYVLDRTSGQVRFGDGKNGSIPAGNVQNPDGNIVARLYRFGGGKSGNVGPGTLTTLMTSVAGIDENGVTNLQAAYGGQDEETLDDARQRAPKALKSKCRAVTAEDFEFLAQQAGNIKRAKALPLFHPGFSPDVKVPGVVTVIVIPDSDDPKPVPSDGLLRTVCAYLNQRRLLTTELYVMRPTYQQVTITAEITVQDTADLAEVQQSVEAALLTYFHPLTGGEDGLGWPFGGTIYYSRVYQQVFNIPGVQSIEHLIITLDSTAMPECTDVPLPLGVMVYSTEHDIQVSYAFNQ